MKQLKLIIAALFVFSPFAANADVITWSGSSLIDDGAADISTDGTLVEAHNTAGGSSIFAGGVLFDDAEPNSLGLVFSGANPGSITGDTNFDSILNTASYALSDIIFTIDGLTSGVSYLVQFFVADSRSCCLTRTVTVDDTHGNTLTSGFIGDGYAFTGLFTATGITQDVRFSGAATGFASVPYMNAWQLRSVDVPEPAPLGLLGLGLAAMGMSRRKKKV